MTTIRHSVSSGETHEIYRFLEEQSSPVMPSDVGRHTSAVDSTTAVSSAHKVPNELDLGGAGVREALKVLNDRLHEQGKIVAMSLDKESGRVVVTIKEKFGDSVVFQIPSKSSLELQRQLDKLLGVLVDHYE